jgi:hypothetical protein
MGISSRRLRGAGHDEILMSPDNLPLTGAFSLIAAIRFHGTVRLTTPICLQVTCIPSNAYALVESVGRRSCNLFKSIES